MPETSLKIEFYRHRGTVIQGGNLCQAKTLADLCNPTSAHCGFIPRNLVTYRSGKQASRGTRPPHSLPPERTQRRRSREFKVLEIYQPHPYHYHSLDTSATFL